MSRPAEDGVNISDYDPAWPGMFRSAAEALMPVLTEGLGGDFVTIEHFGSTAVMGLHAKPLIDMLVGVKKLADDAVYEQLVGPLGYIFMDDVSPPDRRVFRKGMPRTHHLHFVVYGTESWVRPLVFRDAMRDNAELREQYMALKIELVTAFADDRDSYTYGKTDFITQVTDAALPGWLQKYQKKIIDA